ncbi:MAG: hypothetical protein Rhims3KO_18250 [Hyphomicrobiales bacterium]
MARSEKLRILAYDVSCNRRRRRVARALEEHGTRVQLSVFEARLTQRETDKLVKKIEAYLGPSDSLRIYTVGKTGERNSTIKGSGVPIECGANYWLF